MKRPQSNSDLDFMSKIEEEDLILSSHYSSPMSNIVTSLLVTTTGDEGEEMIMYIYI